MSVLLSIETAFLNLPQVKLALDLQNIRSCQRVIANGQKKKFAQTITLASLVVKATEWFASEEGIRTCTFEGISWTNEQIGAKVFGWQKSYFYKVVKVGKLAEGVVSSFNTKCDEVEANGEEPNRTLEGLLKYAKLVPIEGEGGEGEGEGAEPEVEVRVENIFTLTYKPYDGSKVSVKIDAQGNVKTNNIGAQIDAAIDFLKVALQHANID